MMPFLKIPRSMRAAMWPLAIVVAVGIGAWFAVEGHRARSPWRLPPVEVAGAFPRFEAAFAKFESGDIAGALADAERVGSELARSRPKEASRALTLAAEIVGSQIYGRLINKFNMEETSRIYLDALRLDPTNAVALGRLSRHRHASGKATETATPTGRDLVRAAELGDALSVAVIARTLIGRGENLERVRAGRDYAERAVALGYAHMRDAVTYIDYLLFAIPESQAEARFVERLDDASPYVFAGLQTITGRSRGLPLNGSAPFMWGYIATIAIGERSLIESTIVSVDINRFPLEQVERSRRDARRWIREQVLSGRGRWHEAARHCFEMGIEHPAFGFCSEMALPLWHGCLSYALWRDLSKFANTEAHAICSRKLVHATIALHAEEPDSEKFQLR